MIFDTHAHYDDEAFDEDRDELLSCMVEQGIAKIVNIGSSFEANEKTLKLAQEYDFIKAAFGIHPEFADQLNEENFKRIEELCRLDQCVAVGEIGLDCYWPEPDVSIQKPWFERQMDLARRIGKPIVVHSRDAAQETYEMMKAAEAGDIGGVVHCFSYSKEMAKLFVDMGFYIGVGGVITFKNGKKLKEVVEYIPLEHIVLETDCPYLAPVPFRGKRNSSLLLPHVVEAISQIKGISREEVERITWDNAHRLYRL
ncbi:MAG: TatD family hydrolase [Lachnospiraceae bacterium]|nr:TatD family hydrolase [Lachnospiraceae bacterium]